MFILEPAASDFQNGLSSYIDTYNINATSLKNIVRSLIGTTSTTNTNMNMNTNTNTTIINTITTKTTTATTTNTTNTTITNTNILKLSIFAGCNERRMDITKTRRIM